MQLEKRNLLFFSHLISCIFLLIFQISQKENKIKRLEGLLQACSAPEGSMPEDNVSPFEDKQIQAHVKLSKLKQDSLQEEINQLETQFRNVMLENRKAERLLQEVSLV